MKRKKFNCDQFLFRLHLRQSRDFFLSSLRSIKSVYPKTKIYYFTDKIAERYNYHVVFSTTPEEIKVYLPMIDLSLTFWKKYPDYEIMIWDNWNDANITENKIKSLKSWKEIL